MTVRIRVAGPADVSALAALRRRIRGGDADPDFEARFAAWTEREGERRTTWVAEHDTLIGCASLFEYHRMPAPDRSDTRWGYLGNMMVVEERRDAGVGWMLLEAVIAAADERGYARILLAPSPRSIPFYARAGFIDAGPDAGGDRLLVRSGIRGADS